MGCKSCGSGGCSKSGGCLNCGTMTAFDWLKDMVQPVNPFDAIEVRFKNGRKEYFRNVNNLELFTGDLVVVETSPGHHVGEVTLQGELVRLQLQKKKIEYNENLKIIYRKATQKDISRFEEARNREMATLYRSREIIRDQSLQMKLSDVEYQGDNTKATFYYSADERVDFRELIKILAKEYKIRVEMKQISLRQEAGRLGGIGSCGRELCCSTWLNEFKSVSTSAARYQNLALNPSKLSGQCGRLKCCLNYELETYQEALKDIPEVNKLETVKGKAKHLKTDIFKGLMWFAFDNENNWHALTIERVKEVMELNAKGEFPFSLDDDKEPVVVEEKVNNDLDKLDQRLSEKRGNKGKGGNNRNKKFNKNRNKSRNNSGQQNKGNNPNPQANNNPNQGNNPKQGNRPNKKKRRPNNKGKGNNNEAQ